MILIILLSFEISGQTFLGDIVNFHFLMVCSLTIASDSVTSEIECFLACLIDKLSLIQIEDSCVCFDISEALFIWGACSFNVDHV